MKRSAAAGFTLIELLVVLAIFGLMSAMLSGGFHSLSHIVETGNRRVDRTAQLTLTANFLHRVVADARPLPDGADRVMFEGTEDAVRFVGAPPVALAKGGFHMLQVDVEGKPHQLVFRSGPMGDTRPARSILLDGVADARFAYFGRLLRTQPANWHDQWPGTAGLPQLIRLRVTFTDGSSAPDLIVAPRPTETGFQ
ncbi:MAG TPA: prepilin-type N-terminal cleavage/methylation domain-containing protein [Aliidongia sp.]|uniref:prepilin-type N-terminal cleavage/methylation domain-containing protein n=1 Tax=Aliidongia sp. TaxID=1914230 RepID=UPI002DDCF8D0|nr:prepilin-type N-terminal cleavage/methylation domain-containing protein [Aliidongia sp.]HEV2673305.1 prepilin-type N-terminal cleavage/methylation domain-containing protein [Aliidongia sp.]